MKQNDSSREVGKIVKSRTIILPFLGAEYDKNYYIKRREMDFDLLALSGFRIGHEPYWSMAGLTHEIYQINPHTKFGIDAASAKAKTITFQEFLQLYEGKKKTKVDKNLLRFLNAHEKYFADYFMAIKQKFYPLPLLPFIFPQLKGTDSSEISDYYALSSLEDAVLYYDNLILKHNIDTFMNVLLTFSKISANELFKDEAIKLQASMTLFFLATKQEKFKKVLDKYFNGELDQKTIDRAKVK